MFRAYRESHEEQKVALEQRFRGLLEESLEDAIYLAAVKSELKLQVQDLRQGKIAIILYNDSMIIMLDIGLYTVILQKLLF